MPTCVPICLRIFGRLNLLEQNHKFSCYNKTPLDPRHCLLDIGGTVSAVQPSGCIWCGRCPRRNTSLSEGCYGIPDMFPELVHCHTFLIVWDKLRMLGVKGLRQARGEFSIVPILTTEHLSHLE